MIVTEKKKNPFFSAYDPLGVKLSTPLRLQFSNLNKHKFRHGFGDTVSPICGCNAEIEDTEHFLLRCHFYSTKILELFNNINLFTAQLGTKKQVNILLYFFIFICDQL